jgi:hypothetical protein
MLLVNFMQFETAQWSEVFLSGELVGIRQDESIGTEPEGQGKSSVLIALLLGLGYDVLGEPYMPASLCGRDLQGERRNIGCMIKYYATA